MKQYTESQYDDDLTLGSDDYDESYYSDADDLFEFSTDNASPISRLKSLVLSIDWEITDDVLRQFNEELVDLKSIWAGETINLVYVQALEKVSKYIYQNKAESHPSAIKLLLTFYYNLEKIVSSSELREEQKKEILLEDVKRFENFKRQIKVQSAAPPPVTPVVSPTPSKTKKVVTGEQELLNLKAIVLGIDWEITEQDLNDLRREVFRLEEKYSASRPKLILLQGIGTLAAYIKVKRSNSHPDAFKVLVHFYECLEKIVKRPMTLEEEKAILFPAVEQFNAFKSLLGPTITSEVIVQKEEDDDDDDEAISSDGSFAPALADVDEGGEMGFQADHEAMALGLKDPAAVTSHIDDFFGETDSEPAPKAEEFAVEEKEEAVLSVDLFADEVAVRSVDKAIALQGVDVGEEDEDEPAQGERVGEGLLPSEVALAEEPNLFDETGAEVEKDIELTDVVDEEGVAAEAEILGVTESIFPKSLEEELAREIPKIVADKDTALLGVNVETEADDDSDELSLPMEGEELAPALASSDEESLFSTSSLDMRSLSEEVAEEITGTMDSLFLEEEKRVPVLEQEVAVGDELTKPSPVESPLEEKALFPEEESLPPLDLIDHQDEVELEEDGVVDEAVESIDLFSTADLQDEPQAVAPPMETDADDAPLEPPPADILEQASALESEEAVEAFFVEEQTEAEIAVQEEDIEDLFDSLEADLALEEPEKVEDVDLEQDVARFFEGVEDEADTTQTQVEVIAGTAAESAVVRAFPDTVADVTLEEREEEVVFELVEEEPEEEVFTVAGEIQEELLTLAPAEGEEKATEVYSIAEEAVDEFADQPFILPIEPVAPQGPLAGLQSCIDSLKLELSDKILNTLFAELNGLRQRWADRPLEKTFLQLLSTVTQHIDSYRYESSAEAHGLLVLIADALATVAVSDDRSKQELLLAATLKVLEWQQGMLSRQAVRVGDHLTFVDPLRTEGHSLAEGDAQEDFDSMLEQLEEGGESLEDDMSVASEGVSAVEPSGQPSLSTDEYADDLKKEIAALRETLQLEIAELRRELRRED